MIKLSNLHTENSGSQTKLLCDIQSDVFTEKTMWVSVPDKYSDMLTDTVYDGFLTAILFPAMYYGEDIVVDGNVSKKLYKNIYFYVQSILKTYACYLNKIDVKVKGFTEVNKTKRLVGSGFSAGVDSFSTFYDHFEKESDCDYKINCLFFFNVGSHGAYSKESTVRRFQERYQFLKKFPKDIGVPFVPVDSNIHYFHKEFGHQKTSILTLISAVQIFQKVLTRYYVSNAYTYYEEKKYALTTFDFALAEFGEFYTLPLLSPDGLDVISDGAQHTRTEKTETISNYKYAQQYLNVCVAHPNEYVTVKNCSRCSKCLRTLMALDSMDKLNEFSNVFDLDVYKKNAFKYKCLQRLEYTKNGFAKDNVDYARKNNKHIPSFFVSFIVCSPYIICSFIKNILRKALGNRNYDALKKKVKHA